jgi:hypothetical protein
MDDKKINKTMDELKDIKLSEHLVKVQEVFPDLARDADLKLMLFTLAAIGLLTELKTLDQEQYFKIKFRVEDVVKTISSAKEKLEDALK